MLQRPHEAEEEYFARLEVEKKCKIAEKKRAELQNREIEELKKIHQMHCGACGFELSPIIFKGMMVNKCFHCDGAFLSKEAFQKLCGEDNHFLQSFLEILRFNR